VYPSLHSGMRDVNNSEHQVGKERHEGSLIVLNSGVRGPWGLDGELLIYQRYSTFQEKSLVCIPSPGGQL
jgi:hypothetical protein